MSQLEANKKSHRLLWISMAVVLAFALAAGFFKMRQRSAARMQASNGDKIPAASVGYYWAPVGGEKEVYQTMLATESPDGPTVKYSVHANPNASIEVGLVRTAAKFSNEDEEFTFEVYELEKKGKRKLLDKSLQVPVNSWNLFQIDEKPTGLTDGETEFLYVLKSPGLKQRLAFLTGNQKPFYKDFAFPAPGVLHQRRQDDLNVILVSFDSLRADRLGCMGYPEPTSPAIDALAARGVLFTQAISASPWTTTSHFSLLSGLYPSAHVRTASLEDRKFSYLNKMFPGILKDNGYYTIGITAGMGVSSIFGFGKGFNRYIEFNSIGNAEDPQQPWDHEDGTRKLFEYAIDWLDANRGAKFFMFLHNYECHDPYEGTQFLQDVDNPGFIEERSKLYDGDIQYADAFFGKLIDKLEALGLLSNTIIVFTSDHGEDMYDHFREEDRIPPRSPVTVPQISNVDHGHSVYDELVRVPLIFYIPGLQPAKQTYDNQVRLIDIVPTLLDYLDIPHDGPMQGTSLLEMIRTGDRDTDPPAISEYTGQGPEQKSVRMNGYKYIYTPDINEKKYNITFRNIPKKALFDLSRDPEEKNNLYSQNEELANEYHAVLEAVLKESANIRGSVEIVHPSTEMKDSKPPQDILDGLKSLGYLQ